MLDGNGRKINYLRLSVTDRCNLRCRYCMPDVGIEKCTHQDILSYEKIIKIVSVLSEMGIDKVRITGGEPLIRKGITELICSIKRIKNIKEIAITTNGILLEEMAEDLKKSGVDRVNISLDTLNEERYKNMTRGGDLSKVLRGINKAKEVFSMPIKLNVVLIGGFNDDEIKDFARLTINDEIDVRFIELMPIGEVATWNDKHFVSSKIVLDSLEGITPIKTIDLSSPANYYKLPEAKGKIGLIRPISCKFCDNCNRIRLTSDGKLKYCLHSEHELDLNEAVKDNLDLTEIIKNYVDLKPKEHNLEEQQYLKKSMNRIGG
jgi:GTP 3',8-cyclase